MRKIFVSLFLFVVSSSAVAETPSDTLSINIPLDTLSINMPLDTLSINIPLDTLSINATSDTLTNNAYTDTLTNIKDLYRDIELSDIMTYELFEKIINGYNIIEKNKSILTYVDYTKSYSKERMYIIDIKNKKILYRLHVTHGINSGKKYATIFSNIVSSLQSSLGFILTANTYYGRNGYSLKLQGLEEGINDNIMRRYIVFHKDKGATPSRRNKKGKGKFALSEGCLSIAPSICSEVIDVIKGGSVIFIYANQVEYMMNSKFM